jgi:hypothetical protein
MAKTYREIAIEDMLRTVEEAMSQVINWWGDLPPPMKEAIEQFRIQLGACLSTAPIASWSHRRQDTQTFAFGNRDIQCHLTSILGRYRRRYAVV